MIKTFTKEDFSNFMTSTLMEIVDDAKSKDRNNAAMGIMMSGILILQKIKEKIFDDDTESITITKE